MKPTVLEIADYYLSTSGMQMTFAGLRRIEEHILENYPVGIRVYFTDNHAYYSNLEHLTRDVQHNLIRVFTGGNDPVTSHAVNLLARVSHDVLHVDLQVGFSFEDECEVYHETVKDLGKLAGPDAPLLRDFYWSEIVGQAAVKTAVGYFPYQKVVPVMKGFV